MLFLEILGLILKILGILLLCILLLLLFILLVLLFVPIRYRAKLVRNREELSLQAQVSYLFRLIRLPVNFRNGSLHMKLSVFGVTLFSNEDGRKKRGRKKKKKESGKEEERSKDEKGTGESTAERAEESAEKGVEESATDRTEKGTENRQEDGSTDKPKESGTNHSVEAPEAQQREDAGESSTDAEDGESCEGVKELEDSQEPQDTKETQEDRNEQDIPGGLLRPIWRFVYFLKRLLDRIKAFFGKIARMVQSIKEKYFSVKTKISDIKGMAQLVLGFLRDEENKNGIKYAGKSIFRLLKHVFPYKIEGDIVFATGDSYSTGRILSVLGTLYPLYARALSLSADFTADRFRLDGCVQLKGRIRLATVLWIAWRMWSKGKLKNLLSKAKELKNKLTTSAL